MASGGQLCRDLHAEATKVRLDNGLLQQEGVISTRLQRFIDIQLLYTHLTPYGAFSLSFTTATFGYSSIRWFVQPVPTACTIGLLSSHLQHLKN